MFHGLPAPAKGKVMANPNPSPATRFEVGNRASFQHGLTSARDVIPSELTEEERAVWEATPVPPGAPDLLAIQFRQLHVIQWRVWRWLKNTPRASNPKSLAGLERLLRALDVPMARMADLFDKEVKQRLAGDAGNKEALLREYFANLTNEQLADVFQGMAPPVRRLPGETDG